MKQAQQAGTHEITAGPVLVLIRGLPGSGKSYLAAALRDRIGDDKVVLLDPDTIDYASDKYITLSKSLAAEGIEEKFYPNRFLKAEAYQAIGEHRIIIWNQPFTEPGGFDRTIASVRAAADEQHIPLPILLVEVEVNHETAKQRIAVRKEQGGHGPSADRFARFIDDYVSFADRGHPTIVVRGDSDVSESVSIVIEALQAL